MYTSDALKRLTIPCPDALADPNGVCYREGHVHSVYDSRSHVEGGVPCVMLEHSCGAWVIGGPKQVTALIADLQAALVEMGEGDG